MLQGGVGQEGAEPFAHQPFEDVRVTVAVRPERRALSLTCSARRRSRPMVAPTSATSASTPAAWRRRNPRRRGGTSRDRRRGGDARRAGRRASRALRPSARSSRPRRPSSPSAARCRPSQRSRICVDRRRRARQPGLEPRAEVRADVEDRRRPPRSRSPRPPSRALLRSTSRRSHRWVRRDCTR